MNATFHIAGDLDIAVISDKHDRTVSLTVIAGQDFGEGCSDAATSVSPRRTESYPLTPSTARALASALMGAAAEV
jgi:hypothetical protein